MKTSKSPTALDVRMQNVGPKKVTKVKAKVAYKK